MTDVGPFDEGQHVRLDEGAHRLLCADAHRLAKQQRRIVGEERLDDLELLARKPARHLGELVRAALRVFRAQARFAHERDLHCVPGVGRSRGGREREAGRALVSKRGVPSACVRPNIFV
jgi:hypothetical protein